MHSALIERLASQHAEELRTTAATRRPRDRDHTRTRTRRPPAPSVTQRAGWALIQAGLWLAVRPADPRPWSAG
jgi:hypothetical protein